MNVYIYFFINIVCKSGKRVFKGVFSSLVRCYLQNFYIQKNHQNGLSLRKERLENDF